MAGLPISVGILLGGSDMVVVSFANLIAHNFSGYQGVMLPELVTRCDAMEGPFKWNIICHFL